MRAGSAKRRPSNSLRTRKSRYSVNPAMSRATVRRAKRRVRQNFARSNIRRILLCYGALAGYRDGVKQGKRRPRCSSVALRRHRRCRSDERLQQARGLGVVFAQPFEGAAGAGADLCAHRLAHRGYRLLEQEILFRRDRRGERGGVEGVLVAFGIVRARAQRVHRKLVDAVSPRVGDRDGNHAVAPDQHRLRGLLEQESQIRQPDRVRLQLRDSDRAIGLALRRHEQIHLEGPAADLVGSGRRAAPEYAGVEEPRYGNERRVVRAVEADLAQVAARARESRRRADLVRHGLEARVRLPLAFRAQVIGEALPGRVVAVAVDEAGIAASLDLDRARRRERHLALRERELLRLRVGGAERKAEALQTDRGHAGRGLWNRIIFYSTKGLGASPGTGRDAQVSP